MSKSLSSRVARGLVARASSKASRTVAIRPMSRHSRVIPLSSLSKTGMITASLIASQVSIRPAKSATSRRIRSRWTCSTLPCGQVPQPGCRDGVPQQGVALERHAALGEPLGGAQQPPGVGLATLGLEAAPVERQGRGVEQVQPQVGEVAERVDRCAAEGLDLLRSPRRLAVGQRDEVEADVAEAEGVQPTQEVPM